MKEFLEKVLREVNEQRGDGSDGSGSAPKGDAALDHGRLSVDSVGDCG